jgi:ABC-type transport system involved in cytochrome c biogenesis permease component
MTLLPIVARELRVAARRKGTYRMRTWVAAGMLLLCAFVFLLTGNADPKTMGNMLFQILSGGVLAWCLFAGLALTADCLSEEKREGTLGLLFLTDLKGYDVVLGKLATTSINAFYSLLAVLPVLALPLLLGGVSPGEFPRLALVFANTLFLSLCIGLGVSALSQQARKALGDAVLVMLGFALGAPAFGACLEYVTETHNAGETLALPSPLYAFGCAFDRSYRLHPERFWTSTALIHVLSWAWLALACRAARNAWQDRPKAVTGPWTNLWRSWTLGNPAQRQRLRDALLAVNPFLWRVGRERWKPGVVWMSLGVVALVWIGATLKYGRDWVGEAAYLTTAFLLMAGLKLGIAVEAGHTFCEDRRSGALELVLATPLTVREIVRGQWLALRRQFFAPVCVTLGLCFLFLLLTLADSSLGDERPGLVVLWAAVMVMLVADSLALTSLGMWMGLTRNSTNRAAGDTVLRILVLPWVFYAVGIAILAAARSPEPGWPLFLGLWFIPGLVVDVMFGVVAWRKLHREFRQVITERGAFREPWWKRIC